MDTLLPRLDELEAQLQTMDAQVRDLRQEIAALDAAVVDEDALREALERFDTEDADEPP